MTQNSPQPRSHETQQEVPFELGELFFSRTDERGVIRSGNAIFQRVSGYSWSRLEGAPHKLVRHPDMPRGVFSLFWETLKAGKPIGAYVKNREKDGGYYWVYAIAAPVEDGFISVRLKPSSPLFAEVKALYASLLAAEKDEDLSPADSAAHLLDMLKIKGFDSYESFMTRAVAEEVKHRNLGLKRPALAFIASYEKMIATLEKIETHGTVITDGFQGISTSPTNMRILASRMGDIAAPLSVISKNFITLTDDIRVGIRSFLEGADSVFERVNQGLFVGCASEIQSEVIHQFLAEDDAASRHSEIAALRKMCDTSQKFAEGSLREIYYEVGRFLDVCNTLARTLSGLSITSVMSQIESARIGDTSGDINEIMRQLSEFQISTQDGLNHIQHDSSVLHQSIGRELQTRMKTDHGRKQAFAAE